MTLDNGMVYYGRLTVGYMIDCVERGDWCGKGVGGLWGVEVRCGDGVASYSELLIWSHYMTSSNFQTRPLSWAVSSQSCIL